MNDYQHYARFLDGSEPFAAGYFGHPERSQFYRMCEAFGTYYAMCALPPYHGEPLYPVGFKFNATYGAFPDYSYTFAINTPYLIEKCGRESTEALMEGIAKFPWLPTPHSVGGYAYVHSFPNYERVAGEGLASYRTRIENMKNTEMRDGLLCLLDGIKTYHARCLALLKEENAPADLIEALTQVPFYPARNIREAMICRNFVFYLDFCDNPGRIDAELAPYYQGEDITDLLNAFFDNVERNDSWSMAIGPDYNPITLQVLSCLKGRRRPSTELRITPDMPDALWEAAAQCLKSGSGSPSLYNEALYQAMLKERFPRIPDEDRIRFNGGGCTETMLAGISRVGSLDMGINSALVFRDTMVNALAKAEDFDSFYQAVIADQQKAVDDALDILAKVYEARIEGIPQPVRTLLIDDCIDKELDFNAGGARWNWSIINFAGMVNVIDSLIAIRYWVFEKQAYDAQTFLRLLDEGDEGFYQILRQTPYYGADIPESDGLAGRFAADLFATLDGKKPVFGECFLPSSIQFTTYVDAGRGVGATPDGRRAGEPLADSLAPIHGNDKKGPTAMLKSVTSLPLSTALGTPVLNVSLTPAHVASSLKPLIQAYFALGGMQAQVTCADVEAMKDAMIHPEAHENLVVRIGGYSEYFNRLSEELKRTVIARTVSD